MNNTSFLKFRRSHMAILATLIAMLALTITVFAAEMHGLDGTMRVDTPVRNGAGECYQTIFNVSAGDEIMVLARNADGSWVFIWSDAGDGWAPASTVNAVGDIMTLKVWKDHFNGAVCGPVAPPLQDHRICGTPGTTTSAITTRYTHIYTTAHPEALSGRGYPPNTTVTLLGRDFWGCWVSFQNGADSGWLPINALNQTGIMGLPILVDNSRGCTIAGGTVTCPAP